MSSEGYLILATGHARYLEMARTLAASIRIMDRGRRICLVHDENYEEGSDDAPFFDDFAVLPNDELYPGFMNKIRLHDASPYQRAMFVDADCILMKHDVETWWEQARSKPFAITGARKVQGEWKGAQVEDLLLQEGAEYLVQMNSGVFCFDRSPAASKFFAGLNDFYLRRRDMLGIGLHRGKPAQTDEIYIGLWMGLNGLDAVTSRVGENSWMASTWRGFFYQLDPSTGRSVFRKPSRSTMGVPNPILGWDKLSPTFVHFVGLKPRWHYDRIQRFFRRQVAAGSAA